MREGLIPTVLGTVVSASGAAFLGSKYKLAATGVLGFGQRISFWAPSTCLSTGKKVGR